MVSKWLCLSFVFLWSGMSYLRGFVSFKDEYIWVPWSVTIQDWSSVKFLFPCLWYGLNLIKKRPVGKFVTYIWGRFNCMFYFVPLLFILRNTLFYVKKFHKWFLKGLFKNEISLHVMRKWQYFEAICCRSVCTSAWPSPCSMSWELILFPLQAVTDHELVSTISCVLQEPLALHPSIKSQHSLFQYVSHMWQLWTTIVTTILPWGNHQRLRKTVTFMEIKFFCHLAVVAEFFTLNGQILVLWGLLLEVNV
jgi:hypothetical protein